MSVNKFGTFGGMLPAVDDRLLPSHAAALSRNSYLYSGTLNGWRTPKLLFNLLSSTTRAAYRIPADKTKTKITDTSYWLEFADVNTNVLRTPVINDSFERYYYASPSQQPKYNTLARIAAAQAPWLLGVPAPTATPGVTPSGGTGAAIQAARSYVYTYVTAYGEESAPSPPLVVNGYVDDTWEVTWTAPVSGDMGTNRNITNVNIYRTVTATDGTATFFLVTTQPAATVIYEDSLTDDLIAQNVTLPSATWTPPPTDLQGFVTGANGMIVGFRSNEVWFCEPFRPHAWPDIYTVTTEFPIVGLAACGQAIIVITEGYPVVLSGVAPNTISSNVVKQAEPCTSRGSIVSGSDAVYYTSPNGLIAVTPYGGISNATEEWITRDKWRLYAPLPAIRAVLNGPAYFGLGSIWLDPTTGAEVGTYAQLGISINAPQTSQQSFSAPTGADITNPAFSLMTAPGALDVFNVFTDFWTAIPMIIQNQQVFWYDFTDAAPTIQPYLWRSRVVQENSKRNYEAMRVWFTVPPGTTPQNVTRNTAPTQTLAADQYGLVRVYADNVLVTTRELRTSGELMRIPSGFKAEFWQWEIEGRVEVYNLQTATSVKELANA